MHSHHVLNHSLHQSKKQKGKTHRYLFLLHSAVYLLLYFFLCIKYDAEAEMKLLPEEQQHVLMVESEASNDPLSSDTLDSGDNEEQALSPIGSTEPVQLESQQ
jgi:hypothetical protein